MTSKIPLTPPPRILAPPRPLSNQPTIIETPTLIGTEIQNIIVVEPDNDLDDSIDNELTRVQSKHIPIISENNGLTYIKAEINDNSP